MSRFLPLACLSALISTLAFGQVPANTSWVRVVHGSADAPALDVLANGNLLFQGLSFMAYTELHARAPRHIHV